MACSLTLSLAQLLALEYNIGLPARTINVNTVQNLDFCELFYSPSHVHDSMSQWPTVRADLHKSFDRNDWILIPSTDVLSRIEQQIQSFVQERDGGAETSSDIYDEVDSITYFFSHPFAHRNSVCLFSSQLARIQSNVFEY